MGRPLKKLLKIIATSLAGLLAVASLAIFLLFYAPEQTPKPGTIRIACVGDSITFGLLAVPRAFNTYPVQLQKMLGDKYSVRNFGVNAHAAQKASDRPYWQHADFQKSSDFAPNIVVLMLGTNDARTGNWKSLDQFLQDYSELVAHYQSLPSKPIIYVMSPPAVFAVHGNATPNFGIPVAVIDEISAGVKKFAEEKNIGFIDIHAVTAPRADYFTFDGIHPNVEGTRLMAETVYAALIANSPAPIAETQ